MDDRDAIAWLGRKIGWGFVPGQFDDWMELGPEAVIDQLVEPAEHGIPVRGDRFAGVDTSDRNSHRMGGLATVAWIENAVQSPRQLETFMEFFWSGFFAVSLRAVRPRILMMPYMNQLADLSFGNFETMLSVISREPAMLDFLDGAFNTRRNPNENYARELLELYSVGVGNFDEDDVYAASRALTGWRLDREAGLANFRPQDHDDTEHELLGVSGVNDLFTTVQAAVQHEATAPRVVGLLADAILGHGHDTDVTASLVENFADDLEIKPVVRGLLELGVEGHAVPSLLEPLGWYVSVRRCPTRFPRERMLRQFFEQSGQLPLFPPNVGGYPDPDSYLSTSATIARINMATHLVERTLEVDAEDLEATTEDLDALAFGMGLIDGFAPGTVDGLESVPSGGDRMAAALACPDLLVV